jgi:hypothetical protein
MTLGYAATNKPRTLFNARDAVKNLVPMNIVYYGWDLMRGRVRASESRNAVRNRTTISGSGELAPCRMLKNQWENLRDNVAGRKRQVRDGWNGAEVVGGSCA